MRKLECPTCKNKYAQIALHWNRSECNWPKFSQNQMEVMRGLLLGDADIKKGTNGSIFRIRLTNCKFLKYLNELLHPLSRGVELQDSATERTERFAGALEGTGPDSEFSDLYCLRTITHGQIDELRSWYNDGKKVFPDKITDEMFRYWFVCDGWRHDGSSIRIRCVTQSDSFDRITEAIEADSNLEVSSVSTSKGVIRMTAESSRMFWDNYDPVPGFEYKWP